MSSSVVESRRLLLKYAGVPILSRAFLKWIKAWIKSIFYTRKKYSEFGELIDYHYKKWSSPNHRTRSGMEVALLACDQINLIVETGTSAWGCDSSRLLDMVARSYGATFASVDLRPEASQWLKHQVSKNTFFFVQDSLEFFSKTFPASFQSKIDFAYLDSYDLDFLDPEPSEKHCLQEFIGLCKFSRSGTIVLIDDTPANLEEVPEPFRNAARIHLNETGRIPGKGSLVRELVKFNDSFKVLWDSDNFVIRINKEDPLSNLIKYE